MSFVSGSLPCLTSSIAFPVVNRLNFTNLQAESVSGYSTMLPGRGYWIGHDALNTAGLSFCNVSLTYHHNGHTEPIHVQVYLPLAESWNGRLAGVGGGGWAAGLTDITKQNMVGAVSEGFIAVSTDGGGHPYNPDPENWVLHEDGSVNSYLLDTFANRALRDTASIGKALAKDFYGTPPNYSYWSGCSQGGRQGYALAQKYPDAYDGILAFAPALHIPSMLVAYYWTHHIMNLNGEYPHRCEMEALTNAAIAACDHEDGLWDGIISDPDLCASHFSPYDLVGTTAPCVEVKGNVTISETAARVAKAAWTGPKLHNGVHIWPGHSPDADLVGQFGRARTLCKQDRCYASHPHNICTSFITYMVRKGVDLTGITRYGYDLLFNEAKINYDDILATNNPDLSRFRNRGGKLLSIHGLADEIIPPAGTRQYYDSVLERDPTARDYYRHFEAPGVGHCFGGAGPIPTESFADLVKWVEQGKAPETLLGRSPPDAEGDIIIRPLCPYPLVARYTGTRDVNDPSNFYCAESYLSATPIRMVVDRVKNFFGIKFKAQSELR